jgi:hypothetical protein
MPNNKVKTYSNTNIAFTVDEGFIWGSIINKGTGNCIVTIDGNSFIIPTGLSYTFIYTGKPYSATSVDPSATIIESTFVY